MDDRIVPSRFWRRLADEHSRTLAEHGYADIKRRQALRYFTWAWRAKQVRHNEQFRFLLRHTSLATWLRCAFTPVDLRKSTWAPLPLSLANRWLYAFIVRLLWHYAAAAGDRTTLALEEPLQGNPAPVWYRGRLISQDLANSALEVEAIKRVLGDRPAPRRILEIGAGYGRTAHVLLSLYPEATYTIVDIPPAIDISRWYLRQLFLEDRVSFLTPGQVESLPGNTFDLSVSISSLQEMTPAQVARYLNLLDHVTAGGAVYLKQWDEWPNADDMCSLRFADYPIPERWVRILYEQCPVQTMFRQAGWLVPVDGPTRTAL